MKNYWMAMLLSLALGGATLLSCGCTSGSSTPSAGPSGDGPQAVATGGQTPGDADETTTDVPGRGERERPIDPGGEPDPADEGDDPMPTDKADDRGSNDKGDDPKPSDKDDDSEPTDTSDDPGPGTAAAQTADSDKSSADGDKTATESDQPKYSTERFVLLTPEAPLLVELRLTIDGRPYDQILEEVLDHVMEAGDTDGNGTVLWDELASSPRVKYGQYGNMPINSVADRRQMKENYDINRDGRVDRFEIPAFLTRNQGSTRPFTLTSSNQYRGDNQSNSGLKRLLDTDEDGRVSRRETDAAAARLRTRDADEDDILFVADFSPTSNLVQNPAMMMSRRYGPDAAVPINRNSQWDTVMVALQEVYSAGGVLGPDPFALDPAFYDKLDGDDNQELEPVELSLLLELEPHITLEARFGRPRNTGSEYNPLKLVKFSSAVAESQPQVTSQPGRLAIDIAETSLLFYVNDSLPAADFRGQAEAQLKALDKDKNGYLEKSELAGGMFGIANAFEAADADGNGKVFLDEIRDLLYHQQAVNRSRIQAVASDQQDALFAALDTNNDGRLTTREIDAAPALLAKLDRNDDRQLKSQEIPGSMAVALSRGGGPLNARPGLPPFAYPQAKPVDAPAWFLRMDLNRDGEISTREFLGNADRFETLDADHDEFISPAEVKAVM